MASSAVLFDTAKMLCTCLKYFSSLGVVIKWCGVKSHFLYNVYFLKIRCASAMVVVSLTVGPEATN